MKDKLYKTGHKKAYYRLRRAMRLSLFAAALGLATAAPIIIAYGVENAKTEAMRAEESKSSDPIDTLTEEGLLSYAF